MSWKSYGFEIGPFPKQVADDLTQRILDAKFAAADSIYSDIATRAPRRQRSRLILWIASKLWSLAVLLNPDLID